MIIPIGDAIEREATPVQFATIFILAACIAVWGWEVNLTPEPQIGGVAWTAHVGGFASGAVLIFLLRRPGVKLMQEPALR